MTFFFRFALLQLLLVVGGFLIVASPVFALDTPASPKNVEVSSIKSRSAVITWDASSTADSYIVEVSGSNGTQVGIFQNVKGTSKKIGKATVKSNKEYFVKVKGVNDEGGGSFSSRTFFRTKPAKVQDEVSLETGNEFIRLQWHKPRGTIKHYLIQVKRKGKIRRVIKKKSQLTEPWPTATVRGLKPTRKYRFRIRAVFNKKNKGPYSDQIILNKRG